MNPFFIQEAPAAHGQDQEGTVVYPNYYSDAFALNEY